MKLWHNFLRAIRKQSKGKASHQSVTTIKFEPLEIRSLLASHPLVDAPDIDFRIPDEWSTGHTAEFSLINDEARQFEGWQIEFNYGATIGDLWNANVENLGNGRYRITPPIWDNTLDAGESLAIGFTGSGPSSTPTNISFNGSPAVDSGDESDSPTGSDATNDVPVDDVSPPASDELPVIRISDAQVTEGDSGYVAAIFTVSLSKTSDDPVTADFHTMTNSASSGVDFERTTGTVTFAPGETTQTIEVLVKGDLLVEGNEKFEVMLTTPTGGVFEGSMEMHGGVDMTSNVSSGEPLVVASEGTFPYLSTSDLDPFRILDLTSTGAHNVQLMLSDSGDLMVFGPFNGSPVQRHETRLEFLLASTTREFLETRLPDSEEDPNQMISTWMQDPIGGLQISNAHLYCDAAGLFLGEKLGLVGGKSDVGYVVTSHRMDDTGQPFVNVIDGFDPSSDKLDFQYFANREFAVADTPDGLLISASPQASSIWGEKTLLLGVRFSDLTEQNFVFRFEQKYEDGFNRFGGTSETTSTDGQREVPFVASPLNPTNSTTGGGTTSNGDFGFEVSDSWDMGFISQWTFAPEITVGTWKVTLQIDGEIQKIWNAEILSQDNGRYVIGNVDYNGSVAAGQTASFGFEATGSSNSVQILSDAQPDHPMNDDEMTHDDNSITFGVISGFGTIIDDDVDNTDTTGVDTDGTGDNTDMADGNTDMTHDDSHMDPVVDSEYIDLASLGMSHGSHHTGDDGLVNGRTAITTEALVAYNNLREFLGIAPSTLDEVGAWAFANMLTNNTEAWGNDQQGVGLWYAMQGAKVGWISDDLFDPQILVDIQFAARLGTPEEVFAMVTEYGHQGFAEFLVENGFAEAFINTLKMEPHYAGWMHDRAHGWLLIEGDAIAHDVNHLTVLNHEQNQPFMNDTWDWPQWPALQVSHERVLEYFQSMVVLGDPLGFHLNHLNGTSPSTDNDTDTTNGNTDTTDGNTEVSHLSVDAPKLVAYFPEWGIYQRDYHLADVPAADLTHLVYAFANLTVDGRMVLFDSYAAVDIRFAAEDSVTGEADLWWYPADDPRSTQTVWGNFNQLAQLKEQYPHLRTSIALGGWTLSTHFSTVASTEAGRQTLAQSIYDFLDTYTMFDGIDFDWEYPGGGGLETNSSSSQDGANFASLVELVRDQLDLLGSERGRYYEISVASPGGGDKIARFNLSGLKDNVDFFNVMSYDFHGTWENTTGHQAALQNDPIGYDIETAVDLHLNAGVSREQIILGSPLYTRAWSGVADGGDNGNKEVATGAAPGTFESGTYDYKDLLGQITSGTGDWELNWDDDSQAAYLYSASQKIFSSFETPGTVSLKSEWGQAAGLGGMMFWDLSSDSMGPESLIGAAANSWHDDMSFAEITSASDLVFANIYGGNGVFDPVVESPTTPTDPTGPGELGDFNLDGIVNGDDIDALSLAIRSGSDDLRFDIDGDERVSQSDLRRLVNDVLGTHFGDANLDGRFDSEDFVTVFIAGKYLDGVAGNTTWGEGDWNGDGSFDDADIVDTFIDGGYVHEDVAAISV